MSERELNRWRFIRYGWVPGEPWPNAEYYEKHPAAHQPTPQRAGETESEG